MTLLKSRLTALLAALTLTLAGAAGATTYTTVPSSITATGSFNSNFITTPSFDDYIQFSVGAPNGGATWAALSTNFTSVFGLGSLASALYSGTWSSSAGLPIPVAIGTSGAVPIYPGFSIWFTSGVTGTLAVGNYTLRLQGLTEPGGGSYAGTITLAPVPEPGEWALMMSGLGLIGFMVRRRTSRPA